MYADYLREEEGREVYEEPGVGFFTYKVNGDEFFVGDIWIAPEKRGQGLVKNFYYKSMKLAKESGCSYISANIFVEPHNQEKAARKVHMLYLNGYNIKQAHNNVILMIKEI